MVDLPSQRPQRQLQPSSVGALVDEPMDQPDTQRDLFAELDALDDGRPEPIDIERVGLGSAARSMMGALKGASYEEKARMRIYSGDPRDVIFEARKAADRSAPRDPEELIKRLDEAAEMALQLSGMAGRETLQQRIDRSTRRSEVISILPGHHGIMGESWGMMTPQQQAKWLTGARKEINAKLMLLHEQRRKALDSVERFQKVAPGKPLHPWIKDQHDRVEKALADAERREREIRAIEEGHIPPATKTALRSGVEHTAQGLASIASGILKGASIGAAYLSNLPGNVTKDTIIDTKHAGRFKPDDNLVHSLGKWIDAKARQLFPGDMQRREEFSQKLAHGAGSMIGFYGPGVVGRLVSASDKTLLRIVASEGALVGGSETFADAQRSADAGRKVSENQQYFAYLGGLILGTTEALPFERFMRGGRGGLLRPIGEQAGVEAIQEGGQTFGQNVIAKLIHDPGREVFSGVGEASLIGGILGGLVKTGQLAVSPAARAEAREGTERAEERSDEIDLDRFAPEAELDIAERLTWLDEDQLRQLAAAVGVSVDADEAGLRKALAEYVEDFASETAEETGDPERGSVEGRMQALGFLEEELVKMQPNETQRFRALVAGTTPPSQWREELGIPEKRFRELVDQAVKDGLLARDRKGGVRPVPLGADRNKRANMLREQATWARARQIAGWEKTAPERYAAAQEELETLIDRLTKHFSSADGVPPVAAHKVPKPGSRAARKAEEASQRERRSLVDSVAFDMLLMNNLDIARKGTPDATLRHYLGQLDSEQLSQVAEAAEIDVPQGASAAAKRKAILAAAGLKN